jgi:peptidoglycan biosynthesis protein MviN/MurJ (putative lipid II flippase)
MWISCSLVALNLLINVTLVWHPSIHEAAFGIGTALTSTMHVIISTLLLRRRMEGRIGAGALLLSLAKTFLAGLIAGIAAFATGLGLEGLHGDSSTWGLSRGSAAGIATRAIEVFMPLGAAVITFLVMAAMMRMEELRLLLPARSKHKKVI